MRYASRLKFVLVFLIAGLVVASVVYLVAGSHSSGKRQAAKAKEVKLDQAEVVIDGFRFSKTESEKVSWELTARKAEMKRDTGKAALSDLMATFNGKDGMVLTLRADQGSFDSNTKAITLSRKDKDVTITSNNGMEMCVRDLCWDDSKKELTSDSRVVLSGKNIKIEGKGLVARADLQEVRITDGVRTVYTQNP